MQDRRLALRALRAKPIVTAVAIVSLALGIGATTRIFSVDVVHSSETLSGQPCKQRDNCDGVLAGVDLQLGRVRQ